MTQLSSKDIRQQLTDALRSRKADYVEIRLEESETSRLHYRGRTLEEITANHHIGGNVRALVAGGWGFVSFNNLNQLGAKVELAVSQARLVGKETSRLAPVKPEVYIDKKSLPQFPPLTAKKQLLDSYNELIWATPHVQTSFMTYSDGWKHVILATTEGSYIEQKRPDVTFRVTAVARDGGEVQQANLSEGSPGDFSAISNLHSQIKEIAQRAVAMLSAPTVKGGEYTIILDPILAGVFVHEAFGHLSESDFVYENPRLQEIMVMGRRFGGKHLNIVDGALIPNLRGSYLYDDEGVPASKSYLVREGLLVGRLHSRETAAKMGEKTSGNARAFNYRFPPIVRMTNTIIEPGQASFDELIGDIKEGIYAKNWYGGTTSMEMFTFSAGETYMIRNGKVAELLRPSILTGNVFTTLEQIDAIGNDLGMNQGGGCGKGGQVPLPVSNGSPHIRIHSCLVGGR